VSALTLARRKQRMEASAMHAHAHGTSTKGTWHKAPQKYVL